VIYDDPAYYAYRYNRGRNVVPVRPLRPAPRYVFKDVEPGAEYVTRLRQRETHEVRRSGAYRGRTSADVGGRGAVPAPGLPGPDPLVRGKPSEHGPILRRDLTNPAAPPPEAERRGRRNRDRRPEAPEGLRPVEREPRKVPPVQRGARTPQSTGEPELRRRKP
jgi:hypothetical protein